MGEVKQVLVADDEENLRRVLKAQLQHDGYEVHSVADGAEVLQAMSEHHIDVLITDLRMPEMDGFRMLETLRGMPDLAGMDIVVVTGLDAAEIARRGGLPAELTPFIVGITGHGNVSGGAQEVLDELMEKDADLRARRVKALQARLRKPPR